jgi:hypothetical protein
MLTVFVHHAFAAPPESSSWMGSNYFKPIWTTPRLPDGTRDKAWLAKSFASGLNPDVVEFFTNGSATPGISWKSIPDAAIRMVNHWDNFDGSVERG